METTKLEQFRDLVKLIIDEFDTELDFTNEELDLLIRNVYFFISGEEDPMKRDLVFVDPKTEKELSLGNCFFLLNYHYKIKISEKQLTSIEYDEKVRRERKFLDFVASFIEYPRMFEIFINMIGDSCASLWINKAGFFEYLRNRKTSIAKITVNLRFIASELNKIFNNPLTKAMDVFFRKFTYDKFQEYYSDWIFPELEPIS